MVHDRGKFQSHLQGNF